LTSDLSFHFAVMFGGTFEGRLLDRTQTGRNSRLRQFFFAEIAQSLIITEQVDQKCDETIKNIHAPSLHVVLLALLHFL
jgi:hypothetical protein